MIVTQTDRLILRRITPADAAFILALLTDAEFRANIGDRGVHSLADAERAIVERYIPAYATPGMGLLVIEGKAEGVPLGTAGLVARPGLDHIDIGYAMLPAGRGRGYAREAARAVMALAATHGIAPVVAIVSPENAASIAILEALGLVADRPIRLPDADRDVILYIPSDTVIR